jgi:DNA/RNA-binding domain of Phe-tRNA-synthetase-like protein
VDSAIFALKPDYVRIISLWTGLDNTLRRAESRAMLKSAVHAYRRAGSALEEDPRARAWIEARRELGPLMGDGAWSALEWLTWQVSQPGLPSVNPLLDLVHAFALSELVVISALDVEAIGRNVWLRPSRGVETFYPLNDDRPISPPVGELIFVDDSHTVLARGLNWPVARTGWVSADTKRVLLCVDALAPIGRLEAEQISRRLLRLGQSYLGGQVVSRTLARSSPWAELDLTRVAARRGASGELSP